MKIGQERRRRRAHRHRRRRRPGRDALLRGPPRLADDRARGLARALKRHVDGRSATVTRRRGTGLEQGEAPARRLAQASVGARIGLVPDDRAWAPRAVAWPRGHASTPAPSPARIAAPASVPSRPRSTRRAVGPARPRASAGAARSGPRRSPRPPRRSARPAPRPPPCSAGSRARCPRGARDRGARARARGRAPKKHRARASSQTGVRSPCKYGSAMRPSARARPPAPRPRASPTAPRARRRAGTTRAPRRTACRRARASGRSRRGGC